MHVIDDADMDNENENNISGSSLLTANANGLTSSHGVSSMHNISYNPDFEVNNSAIDLDTYTSGFTGLMRVNRLVFLAEHCPSVRVEALKQAITFVLETYNTQLYSSLHKQLTDAYNTL